MRRYAKMIPSTRLQIDRCTVLLAALAVLGAALVLLREITYGVGLEWDSINYISVARNLLAGEGFVQIFGSGVYTRWPPLYPLLLAASGFLVFDPRDVAGPLNAVIFGLTIFVAGQWLRRRIQSRFLVLWACLAIVLSIPLTRVAAWAFSEGPFILFVTLALVRTDDFLTDGKRADLIWAAVFTALACLSRYIGVTLIVAILPLLMLRPGVAFLEKVKHSVAYAMISLVPIGLWSMSNIVRVGEPGGTRQPPGATLVGALNSILGDLSRWVIFFPTSGGVRFVAVVLVGIALIALAAAVGYVAARSMRRDSPLRGWSPFSLFGGFALVYLVSIAVLGAVTFVSPLSGRMTAPAYIPLLFVGVFALDKFLISERSRALGGNALDLPIVRTILRGRKPIGLLAVGILLVASLWLLAHAPLNAREILLANGDRGLGFASAKWIDSEVLEYMREASIDERVISSSPTVYAYANVREYVFLSLGLDKARQKIEDATEGDHVVWFNSSAADYTYGVPELLALPELELVADLPDGVIFRVVEEAR